MIRLKQMIINWIIDESLLLPHLCDKLKLIYFIITLEKMTFFVPIRNFIRL